MENKQDTELIEIIMNCELDIDCRVHAAKEIIKRLGVNAQWPVGKRIMNT
ncbi:hypothetical protein JCM10914A_56140 [Paenibacillus sp. JCM 10914]